MHRLHFVHGIRHSNRMVMDYMVSLLVLVVQLFSLFNKSVSYSKYSATTFLFVD